MLDTVKLRSPYLDEATARLVELALCNQRREIRLATGEVLWEFTRGALAGSWDHRLGFDVKREEWRQPLRDAVAVVGGRRRMLGPAEDGGKLKPVQPVLAPCEPYIELEGSLHKAILGHNVHGGPADVLPACRLLVDRIGQAAGCELPDAALWKLRRVDWAEVFDLGSFDAVSEYLGYMRNAEFPRRKVGRFAHEALHIAGTTSSVKLYHKGPEFEKHDRKRLRKYWEGIFSDGHLDGRLDALQKVANNLLRCEVEIHARALDDEFNTPPGPLVGSPEIVHWIQVVHDQEMARLLREGGRAMGIVRTSTAVRRRLYETYSSRRAAALWGTWLELSAMGEDSARERLPRTTFWRHRKELQDAGCSWHGGDVKLDRSVRLVPEGFTPQRHDPRRLTGEAPELAAALASYRVAS